MKIYRWQKRAQSDIQGSNCQWLLAPKNIHHSHIFYSFTKDFLYDFFLYFDLD